MFKEIKSKSLLKKNKNIDSWFISCYNMNLYRGCSHNCVYCDGRAEGYYVEGDFEKDISVKVNTEELLSRELSSKRKRKPFKKGYVIVGGGVGDSYQPIEEKYRLTRKALHLLYKFGFPVHMLTKSTLIKRDLDILKKIQEKNGLLTSFSFSSTNEKISSIFEPGVLPPTQRLNSIKELKAKDVPCGAFLMPVIPFISDTPEIMEKTISDLKDAGADYIIFGGMTLKEGRQKDYFMKRLETHYPQLIPDYDAIYYGDKWGNAVGEYYKSINILYHRLMKKYKLYRRIPQRLFKDILDENDLVCVILEHLHYLSRAEGKNSPYSYAAYSIKKIDKSLSEIKDNLMDISGIGKVTAGFIREILATRNLKYLEKLHSVLY